MVRRSREGFRNQNDDQEAQFDEVLGKANATPPALLPINVVIVTAKDVGEAVGLPLLIEKAL